MYAVKAQAQMAQKFIQVSAGSKNGGYYVFNISCIIVYPFVQKHFTNGVLGPTLE
jgi:hypothetical protein